MRDHASFANDSAFSPQWNNLVQKGGEGDVGSTLEDRDGPRKKPLEAKISPRYNKRFAN